MWVIEVNVLGRRFTRRVSDHRGPSDSPRSDVQLRLSQLRHPRAAV